MTKIFIVTHKTLPYRAEPPYIPIHVGAATAPPGTLSDNGADSIADKNQAFCELTAHYWVWRNVLPAMAGDEAVGFCHYRRFFDFGEPAACWDDVARIDCAGKIAAALAQGHNAILPDPITIRLTTLRSCASASFHLARPILPGRVLTIGEQYRAGHKATDLNTAIALLPAAHREAFADFLDTTKLSPYNMYIARKDVLNAYFSLLFAWLFAVENNLHMARRNAYQLRAIGFLAERFASYYFARQTNPCYSPVSTISL